MSAPTPTDVPLLQPAGASTGSVAIIRISGADALAIVGRVFRHKGQPPSAWKPKSHRVYWGNAVDSNEATVDEVGWGLQAV